MGSARGRRRQHHYGIGLRTVDRLDPGLEDAFVGEFDEHAVAMGLIPADALLVQSKQKPAKK